MSPPPSALSTPVVTPTRVFRPARATPAESVRPTRAEISLSALRHNLRAIQRVATSPVWGVLKADGYGHGGKAVARTLERAGCPGLCVALLEEGIELRSAGITVPILVMGGYYGRSWGELLEFDLTPVVYQPRHIAELADEVRYRGSAPARVHLKFDTGMGRLGAMPREVAELATTVRDNAPYVELEGLMTHFANADSTSTDGIAEQLDLFDEVTQGFARLGVRPKLRHAANSAALLASPRSHLDFARPGIALFGVNPSVDSAVELRPVMRVRSEIVALRELSPGQSIGYGSTWTARRTSRIATLPMGYADGLSRSLSNRGSVLVRGHRAPIVGTVSMDLTMVDVTEIPGAALGDETVVLGSQKGAGGSDVISATEIATTLGTIPWEILTNVSRRVPRFYLET